MRKTAVSAFEGADRFFISVGLVVVVKPGYLP